jgi:hypothetical protein
MPKKPKPKPEWYELIDLLEPSIVKIETPQGYGSGFLCAYNEDKSVVAIATAHHVVEQADKWLQPIRIYNAASKETVTLRAEADRLIYPDVQKDSAVILVPAPALKTLKFPNTPIRFGPSDKHLKIGIEVAWLGFPSIGPDTLCFFCGKISAWQQATSAYLIDGVAINGVSGGPVFHTTASGPWIIGTITAYMPNRLSAGTLPGLSVAQDVSHFQQIVNEMKNWDEAARKKKEQEAQAGPTPSLFPPEEQPAPPTPTGQKRARPN